MLGFSSQKGSFHVVKEPVLRGKTGTFRIQSRRICNILVYRLLRENYFERILLHFFYIHTAYIASVGTLVIVSSQRGIWTTKNRYPRLGYLFFLILQIGLQLVV